MCKTVVLPHTNKIKQSRYRHLANRRNSQLNQVKQSCREAKKSSGKARVTNLGPEALKIHYKAYGLQRPMAVLNDRDRV